jgi:hypothetical protein
VRVCTQDHSQCRYLLGQAVQRRQRPRKPDGCITGACCAWQHTRNSAAVSCKRLTTPSHPPASTALNCCVYVPRARPQHFDKESSHALPSCAAPPLLRPSPSILFISRIIFLDVTAVVYTAKRGGDNIKKRRMCCFGRWQQHPHAARRRQFEFVP